MPSVLPWAWLAWVAWAEPPAPTPAPPPAPTPAPTPTVTTDRPDATNGTFTVARGVWQLEAGLDATVGRELAAEALPLGVPATLRIGVHERAELRLFDSDPLPWLDARGRGSSGASLGFKIRLVDVIPGRRRPSIGVQPYVTALSYHPRTWGRTAFGGILLWTQPLTQWLAFDANLGLEVGLAGEEPTELDSLASVSAQITAWSRLIPYVEAYGIIDWVDPASSVLAFDGGLVIIAQRRLAFDVAGRVDVVGERLEYGVLAGITVILADGSGRASRVARRGSRSVRGRGRGSLGSAG